MTPPNALTLSRFALTALLMAFLFLPIPLGPSLALAAFILAAVSDAVDGHLARTVYGVTPFGALIDPLADKVLVCAAFVSFVQIGLVPAWIAVLILSREFLVTGLRVLAGARGRPIAARAWGKHKTAWQLVVILVLLAGHAVRRDLLPGRAPHLLASFDVWFEAVAFVIAIGAAVITVASGAVYFHQHRDLLAEHL